MIKNIIPNKIINYALFSNLNIDGFTNHKYINLNTRWSVFRRDNFKCVICGETDIRVLTLDHIRPVAKGGINNYINFCTLCDKCNLLKKDKPFLFLVYQKFLRGENMYKMIKENGYFETKIFNNNIRQCPKTEFFSANDLVKAGNNWRAQQRLPLFNLTAWFNRKDVKEFMSELEKKYGQIKISGRGRNSSTWVHPLLFIDLALAISPTLKIEVYEWIMDELIRFRNDSGDSYKKMIGCLYERCSNKRDFPDYIKKVALQIKKKCEVADWETATEKQLELRDKIHENIALLADVLNNADEAVRIGILKS